MQEETKPAVSRRGLLRRAGTVAAGVGAVGVAGAVVAGPAQAADGANVVIGTVANEGGTATVAAVRLKNSNAAGAPLQLGPTTGQLSAAGNLVGTTYVDNYGDVHVIGGGSNGLGTHYDNLLYSPTWATMTIPVAPARIVNTYPGAEGGLDFVDLTSGTINGAGQVMPKNSTAADLIIDLSPIFLGGFCAIQGNLSVGQATGAGFAALWDEGPWPGASTLNFQAGAFTENFCQTVLGADMKIRLKVSKPTLFFFDVTGFIVTDPFAQISDGEAVKGAVGAKLLKGLNASLGARRAVAPRR